jgi:peroxiredoxin family protein
MSKSADGRKRVALVCTTYTMQSAFGLLILALNSVRLGYETLIYFTFEGLKMIQPGGLTELRYVPGGRPCDEAELERITGELRATMERKDIPYVEDILEMAQLEGVRFLACKTSVDLFDLGPEQLFPGVEIMVAEEFLKIATTSDLHLVL